MQLEGARAELRARPDHEAADLGLLLLRALFRPALRAWLGFVLPLQLLVLLLGSSWAPGLSYLALWWLKPVYDRAFGLVVGRGLFGDAPTLGQLYRALWSDGRRALFGDLLWRRLDPARTLVAPVALLEGLTGNAAARRRRTLGEGSTRTVALLLASCVALELATLAGLIVGGFMLLPDEASFIAESLASTSWDTLEERLPLGAYVLALGVVEPLFVAAGFGLYINRRTSIEGWDIELTFRRMARRLATGLLAGLLFLQLLPGMSASAEEPAVPAAEPAVPARVPEGAPRPAMTESAVDEKQRLPAPELRAEAEASAAMARVLARPELQRTHVEERWELRQERKPTSSPDTSVSWLGWLAGGIASIAELLLWLLAIAALVVVVYLVVQRMQRGYARAAHDASPPAQVSTIRSGEPHAPALALHEVVPAALAHLAKGQHVAALSVLYVGTLAALVSTDGLVVPRQATEGQCLSAVRTAAIAVERRTLFEELTRIWQLSAYAHAQPEQARLEDLCARFIACFGPRP